ncbi:MAG: SDR family oxidoreductase [Caldilineaceae bacterium]|nr:SDR family oxidoreductase [Caldilineaceae bacterium]
MMDLQQRVALVTGAGSGIGRAAAKLMARHGARVVCLSRSPDEVEEVVEGIHKSGGEAVAITADISEPEEMQKAFKQTIDRWGRLDIVFANAGINGVWAPIEELAPDEFEKTLHVNLLGAFLTIKYAVPYLKKQGGSVIINASVNGTRIFSNTGATAYSASKAGQVAMMKMLALELAPQKIRVNAICPGAIDTNIEENTERRDLDEAGVRVEFPEGRIPLTGGESGSSEQVAQLVLFLASDASSHISGTEIWIDGAESLLQG